MNKPMSQELDRIISEFLEANDQPTIDDWKALADQHPQHAAEIAEAAAIRAAGDAAADHGKSYEFDPLLATRTVSKALAMARERSANIDEAASKLAAALPGPTQRREVAIAIGLGSHVSLLNGMVTGRTQPARRALRSLARWLQVTEAALRELFGRAFALEPLPAHKALRGKPTVHTQPISWEQHVRSLGLSDEETSALLSLDDEEIE